MLDQLLRFGIPGFFVFAASYFYSRALLLGIACARDEQHRMTSLSPWYFFTREFKPHAFRIAVALIPWLVFGTLLIWWEFFVRYWQGTLIMDDDLRNHVYHHFGSPFYHLSILLGMTSYSYSTITLKVPRFKSPMPPTLIGTTGGLLLYMLLTFLVYQGLIERMWNELGTSSLVTGFLALSLSWFYVRFKLNHTWFRFEA